MGPTHSADERRTGNGFPVRAARLQKIYEFSRWAEGFTDTERCEVRRYKRWDG